MNTSPTASIKPHFRMIDGVKIRYADSGGSQWPTILRVISDKGGQSRVTQYQQEGART